MTAKVEDYDRVFERFTSDLERLEDIIISVVRFGSIARGELSPGKSDLMDAYVFLNEEAFKSEAVFTRAIESFVDTCQWLSETGLPYYHPFQYYCEDEVENLPAGFAGVMRAEHTSDIFYGEDIRSRLRSSDANRKVAKSAFYINLADTAFDLAVFQQPDQMSEDQRQQVLDHLRSLCKFVSEVVALALDQELSGKDAIKYLSQRYPEGDFAVLAEIKTTRDVEPPSSEEVQVLLGRFLRLIEMLNKDIVDALRSPFHFCRSSNCQSKTVVSEDNKPS